MKNHNARKITKYKSKAKNSFTITILKNNIFSIKEH